MTKNLRPAERALLLRIQTAGSKGVPALRSTVDSRAKDALVAADLIHWNADDRRWRAGRPTPMEIRAEANPTEACVVLDLSEYEASIITGALIEFAEKWGEGEAHTARYLYERVQAQLPADWVD